MNIGIVPTLDEKAGGVYQYSLTMLEALLNLAPELQDSFTVFTDDLNNPKLKKFKYAGWKIVSVYKTTPVRQFVRRLIKNTPFEKVAAYVLPILKKANAKTKSQKGINKSTIDYTQRDWFLSHDVDLMIYPSSNNLSFKIMIPYIFVIHDLNHRIYNEFPEVSAPVEWRDREFIFSNGIRNAMVVLADSQTGKEDILRFYKKDITADKIEILPFLSANYIKNIDQTESEKLRKLFRLPKEYIFYPAQFWPHKNHLRLIKALGLLQSKFNLGIPIVFCGTHTGAIREKTFREVMLEVKRLKLDKNIYYLGYVEDKFMAALYQNAKALVMPTFFGPTNIPILEAWNLDCPVVTSGIRGIREQTGDAAVLVEPRSVESIAHGIKTVWSNKNLRKQLVKSGRQRLAIAGKEDYNMRLRNIINKAKRKIARLN